MSVTPQNVHVRHLYRQILKALPKICTSYAVSTPIPQIRRVIRAKFDQFAHLKDPKAVELMLFKGRLELEEATMHHKTKTHVMRYTVLPAPPQEKSSLESFLEGN
mmetsp:Transcript_28291/g.65176  ORF Transcript_28291/g.65176 Transcript_28291/m.65176 type:complete len:105 (-) Transcript_28291:49-363(-)